MNHPILRKSKSKKTDLQENISSSFFSKSRSRDPTINIETTTDSASTAKPVENNTQK